MSDFHILFSVTHELSVVEERDADAINYVVVCTCGFETGAFMSKACAERRKTYPCEVEAILTASGKRRERREKAA